MSVQTLPAAKVIEYPDSDGRPMADNTLQFHYIVTIKEGLEDLFRDRPDVFVAGDLLWYPVEGQPLICAAPDVLTAFGREKGHRGSYRQWVEGNIAPQVVWEILSPSNRPRELEEKFDFYEHYGVEEYYQYDPDRGRLRGWLREGGRLQEIVAIEGWVSPRLGVRLELDAGSLVLYRPDGQRFKSYLEAMADSRKAQALAQLEQAYRQTVAAQVALSREHEAAAREAAKVAKAGAEDERRQREAAQLRAEKLAAQLRALGIDPEA